MCSVIGGFLGLALPRGPVLRLPDAHRLCPLADSLVAAINSVGEGPNALHHLLNVSSLISDLSRLPFSVAGIFFLSLTCVFSCSFMVNSLWPRGGQHARLPCPSPSPRVCSSSCSLSRWCHPTMLSSVIPFSFEFEFFQVNPAQTLGVIFG